MNVRDVSEACSGMGREKKMDGTADGQWECQSVDAKSLGWSRVE